VDKTKFCITNELPFSRKRELISLEDDDDPDTAAVKVLPMGRNSTKRKLEGEKILASVSKRIEAEKNMTTSSYLAGALHEIAKCVGLAISSWQMQLAIPNASAHLQRQYYDAIVKKNLTELLKENSSVSTTTIPNQIIALPTDGNTTSSGDSTTNNNNCSVAGYEVAVDESEDL
jgi:hypothetical protein